MSLICRCTHCWMLMWTYLWNGCLSSFTPEVSVIALTRQWPFEWLNVPHMDESLLWLCICMGACMLVCSFVWLIQHGTCTSVHVCLCMGDVWETCLRSIWAESKYVCLIERTDDTAWTNPEMSRDKFDKWMCALFMTRTLNHRHVMEKPLLA